MITLQHKISSQIGDFKHEMNAIQAFLWINWIGKALNVWPSGIANLTAWSNSSLPTEKPVKRSVSYEVKAGFRI